VISLLIVVPVLIWEKTALTEGDHGHQAQVSLASQKPTNRTKRSLANKNGKTTDSCLKQYGGMELNYTRESSTGWQFDLCRVIDCQGVDGKWRDYDLYVCVHTNHY